jgi:hypothetical protein
MEASLRNPRLSEFLLSPFADRFAPHRSVEKLAKLPGLQSGGPA